jgi:hypothetical protein
MTAPDLVALDEADARQMAESMGFIYWPGGDAAPADWDGEAYLCRDGKTYYLRGYGWGHGMGCWNPTADWDRIGYIARALAKDTPDAG